MSVVKVALRLEGENGTLSVNSGSTQIVKYYVVQCSTPSDGAEVVATANDGSTSIPALYSALGTTGLVVTDVRPERQGKSAIWFVTVTYGTPPAVTTGGGSTVWGLDISVDGVETLEETDRDQAGNQIVNAAGDPFDPSLQKGIWDEEITLSFHSTTVDTANVDACRGKINSGAISCTIRGLSRTWAAKTLKLVKARYATLYLPQYGTGATQIWDVDYVFQYRPDTWVRQVENKGFYALDSDGKKYLVTDDHGQPKSKPTYLDEDGQELAAGSPVVRLPYTLETATSFASLFSGIGL